LLDHRFNLASNLFCGSVPTQVSSMSSQVTGYDVLSGNTNLGVSCCTVIGIDCTPSPTFSPRPTYSLHPTPKPTSPTHLPTPRPTKLPTPQPSHIPTPSPSFRPSIQPTPQPTVMPSPSPSSVPHPAPTTPMPVPEPTGWIEAEPNTIGVSIGCAGFVIILLVFAYYARQDMRKRQYMAQVRKI
jgi:hypothetical protein